MSRKFSGVMQAVSDTQLQDLFAGAEEEKRQRLEQLDRAMDAIRDKYGKGAIGRASTPKGMDRERHAPPPGGAYHPK